MTIRLIRTTEPAYQQMKELRWKVLLQPIGVPRSYIDENRESSDLLVSAFENNSVIGCCILSHVDTDTVQLRQMAVDTGIQTTGVGRKIVAFAEKTAKDKGYSILMMHARDVVIPFYEKCGYTIADDGFTEVGIPHHKMQKAL